MDFNLATAQASARRESAATFAPEGVGFTSDEWAVVDLARHDSLASLWPPTFLIRLAARVFGLKPAQPLANPRLEIVRRLAVVAWHRRVRGAAAEIRRFVAAGFSSGHARLLIATVEGRRQLAELRGGLA